MPHLVRLLERQESQLCVLFLASILLAFCFFIEETANLLQFWHFVHCDIVCLFRLFKQLLVKRFVHPKWFDCLPRSSRDSYEKDWLRYVNVDVTHSVTYEVMQYLWMVGWRCHGLLQSWFSFPVFFWFDRWSHATNLLNQPAVENIQPLRVSRSWSGRVAHLFLLTWLCCGKDFVCITQDT